MGESFCHVSYATLLCKWVSRFSRFSSARENFYAFIYFCSFWCDCCRTSELIDQLLGYKMLCTVCEKKPTGLSRAGGRHQEQTPILEVGGNVKEKKKTWWINEPWNWFRIVFGWFIAILVTRVNMNILSDKINILGLKSPVTPGQTPKYWVPIFTILGLTRLWTELPPFQN